MNEQEAVAEIDRQLDEVRRSMLAMSLAEVGNEYVFQFNRNPDFSAGQANLVERIILDRRQRALGQN